MAISPGSNNKGSTDYARSPRWWHWNHPRIRGVHYDANTALANESGSSPHTRGPPGIFERRMDKSRFIPAYAGSTLRSLRWLSTTRDHPHIRGVHGIISSRVMKTQGLSPHTRGPRNGSPQLHPPCRIIPAYAGSTQVLCRRRNR